MYYILFFSYDAEMTMCPTEVKEAKVQKNLRIASCFRNFHKADDSHIVPHIYYTKQHFPDAKYSYEE